MNLIGFSLATLCRSLCNTPGISKRSVSARFAPDRVPLAASRLRTRLGKPEEINRGGDADAQSDGGLQRLTNSVLQHVMVQRVIAGIVLAICASVANAGEPAVLQFDNESEQKIVGRDARLQLLVSRRDGQLTDATHTVTYTTKPLGIVDVASDGYVTPIADGLVTVTAQHDDGSTAESVIVVSDTGNEASVSFPSRVVPIFTKLGCNGGGCHGKAAGQNGFKLSLLGFEPREDFEHLVYESRGRRIIPAIPDQSLLLQKAINASPHGGGLRMHRDSYEYRLMRRWIAQGMPYGDADEAVVESIQIVPSERRLAAQATQQLAVIARYNDGSTEDVTRAVLYESNDPAMAEVSATGRLQLSDLIGDVAVMARYQGQVAVFRAIVPLDSERTPLPATEARNVVDTFVFKKLQSLGIPASPVCDDHTFLRRVTLDTTGRLPTLQEISDFGNLDPQIRRDAAIDRLLGSPDYAEFFASKWNSILRNRQVQGATQFANFAFHDWIRESIDSNKPYDQFVREIVAASGTVASHPPVAWYTQVASTTERMEDAAQLFLGQRLQCARCHHHPYEKWSQTDYAEMAAFFATVAKKPEAEAGEPSYIASFAGATYAQPKTGTALPPSGLDAEQITVPPSEDVRFEFADWMTQPQNPFFARALVNRYWKHFMGRGLVEPEDDMRVTNPPTNPELLDAVAQAFIDSGYDLKALIRLLVQSRTYQVDSNADDDNLQDQRNYSRYYPKRLHAEVLLDAIDQVTGSPTAFDGMPTGSRAVSLPNAGFSSYFLKVFGRSASSTACECESTQEPNLAQNLHLLNSTDIQTKLSSDTGRAALLAADTDRGDDVKIVELYQVAFGRPASDQELKTTLGYLAAKTNRREAYEDIVWSLINSKEFLFNH